MQYLLTIKKSSPVKCVFNYHLPKGMHSISACSKVLFSGNMKILCLGGALQKVSSDRLSFLITLLRFQEAVFQEKTEPVRFPKQTLLTTQIIKNLYYSICKYFLNICMLIMLQRDSVMRCSCWAWLCCVPDIAESDAVLAEFDSAVSPTLQSAESDTVVSLILPKQIFFKMETIHKNTLANE